MLPSVLGRSSLVGAGGKKQLNPAYTAIPVVVSGFELTFSIPEVEFTSSSSAATVHIFVNRSIRRSFFLKTEFVHKFVHFQEVEFVH